MVERIKATWIPWIASIFLSVGGFAALSQGHISEVQAMRIAKQEIKERAFPLTDGEVLKRDIKSISEDVKEIKLYVLYLAGIIEKEKLNEERSKLQSKSEIKKQSSIAANDYCIKYTARSVTETACYDMLFSCHRKSY